MATHLPKAPVDQDVVDQVIPLFGTVANAQRLLRLQHIPYSIANAAFRGNPVTEGVNDDVVIAWRTWKQLFVRGHMAGLLPDLTFRMPGTTEEAYEAIDALAEGEMGEWRRKKGKFARMAGRK